MVDSQTRELARRIVALERHALEGKQPNLGYSTIEDGALQATVDDSLKMVMGLQFDGTSTTSEFNGPTPPVPQVPFVTETLGGLRAYWDGTFADGSVAPMDWARVTVHASTDSNPANLNPINPATLVGEITTATGGEVSVSLPEAEHYVFLVTWTHSGKFSAVSAPDWGTPLAPVIEASDGLIPSSVSAIAVTGGIQSAFVDWEPVANPDTVTYEVHASTISGFTPDISTLVAMTPGSLFLVTELADGTPLAYGSTYYFKVVAKDDDGVAVPSPEASGGPAQVTGPDIVTGAVTTDKLAAEAITAGKLESVLVLGTRIVAGDPNGARAEMNSTGFHAHDGVEETFSADTDGNVSLVGSVKSKDYIESESGFLLNTEQTQFPNLNVLGDAGATRMSAEEIVLGGEDLRSELVDPKADGVTGFALGDAQNHTGGPGAEAIMYEYNAGDAAAGRFYILMVQGTLFHTGGANPGSVDFRIRFTTDGSVPTLSSPILDGTLRPCTIDSTRGAETFTLLGVYQTSTDTTPRFALTMARVVGNIGYQIWNTDFDRAPMFLFMDAGTSVTRGGLAQKSINGGGAAQPTPKARYTVSFRPAWGRSYNGDGSIWENFGNETADLYQGQISSTHGNTKSLVGDFRRVSNNSPIMTVLSGATIVKSTITFKVKHAWDGAGLDTQIGHHNSSAKPASWPGSGVFTSQWVRNNSVAGNTYTIGMPDNGVGLGEGLRDGTIRGLAFGPGPSIANNYYGYLYGPGTSQPPAITIVFDK